MTRNRSNRDMLTPYNRFPLLVPCEQYSIGMVVVIRRHSSSFSSDLTCALQCLHHCMSSKMTGMRCDANVAMLHSSPSTYLRTNHDATRHRQRKTGIRPSTPLPFRSLSIIVLWLLPYSNDDDDKECECTAYQMKLEPCRS
jgi:hypothetical protein